MGSTSGTASDVMGSPKRATQSSVEGARAALVTPIGIVVLMVLPILFGFGCYDSFCGFLVAICSVAVGGGTGKK